MTKKGNVSVITKEDEYITEFYTFSRYLEEIGVINQNILYRNDVSAFLLHMSHLKAYDFAQSFCKDKKVLEIGCNIGYGTKILAGVAKEVIAIDFDTKALDYARKNYALSNIKFEETNATNLPYDNETFDVVISFQVIEHIKPSAVPNFLSEINRVLKKEGVVLLTTPNRKLRLYPFQKPWNPEHYTEYTAKGFSKMLKGFFQNTELLGLRAESWIEEIERNRVKKSLYQVCIRKPIYTLLRLVIPYHARQVAKEFRSKLKLSIDDEQKNLQGPAPFNELLNKFSMDKFRFEVNSLDESLYLLAICKKEGEPDFC